MKNSPKHDKLGLLHEAEVAPNAQTRFENRYRKAAGHSVSPGSPAYYQGQLNKWGSELRVYFNDPGFASLVEGHGVNVEYRRKGYRSGEYRFRFNDNRLWWKLVEVSGLRLGPN